MKPETFFAYLGRPYLNTVAVCAWCPDAKLATAAAESEGCDVTHGICPECAAKVREAARVSVSDPEPVVIG